MNNPEQVMEIFMWLKEQSYQTEYEETGEYKMYFELDMPKILEDYHKWRLNGSKKVNKSQWICNECNFSNFTGSVSEDEINQELHACINCGGFEFHKNK